MTREPRFYAIGDNTLDVYVGMQDLTLVGGNALNVAVQLARHRYNAEYAGALGTDKAAETILAEIASTGVGTTDLSIIPGPSAVTRIEILASGDRTFLSEDFGVTGNFVPSDETLRRAAGFGWVHLGMLPEADTVRRRLKAIDPAVQISQDCAVASGTSDLDIGVWSVGPNPDAAQRIIDRNRELGVPLTVVTMGPAGAIAGNARGTVRTNAVDAQIVDTTGAGDSFIAGFLAAHAAGAGLPDALRNGAEWAAVTCGHVGGWPQV